MDYLNLKVTKIILEKIAAKDGLLTWYNISQSIDRLEDVEKVPPPYYLLDELTNLGFLELCPPDGGNYPKYKLTEIGRNFLNSSN
jgi:hypothetical protein